MKMCSFAAENIDKHFMWL